MSEESKEVEVTKESQTLGLNEAKSMTIGEAVRKQSEIKAGVTKDDSILDKYIKQHRDEVSSQKFDAKYTELDTASLDNFIKKQREALSKAGLVDDEPVSAESAEQDSTLVEEVAEDLAPMETTAVVTGIPVEATVPVLDLDPSERVIPEPQMTKEEPKRDQFLSEDSHHPAKQNTKKGWLIALFLLLLAILAVVFGWNHFLRQDSGKTTQTASKQTKTSLQTDSAKKATRLKAAAKAFEKQYGTFYTDATKSKLKNSAFATLPDLEAALKALKGSAYYDKAKAKVDSLKKAIAAITAVNGKFVSDVVVDGEKVSAEVKADANFDDLSSATLTTGNANLDAVLQASITEGRQQLASKAEAAKAANEQAAQAQAAQGQSTSVAPSGYGLTSYDPASLQRHLSRVPYNQDVIADRANPSWAFNPGVLEKIVATSQARGYISGYQYILEPVNIINGNGYYNMFKPDGTYLFSINCKTGYFVGNGKGYADALDY
ncbi:cell division site-positioning protein MapZ family protein [Streptococcus pyogenes]|uniref:cell division site-positioning protein MapZ family protein n=1 Tax=Streptococcus pyogenes TaxID=1314 RepID=UPI000DA35031|nr:cell division site-positioning protein MapZ family protein [Streptococcus pyogenes]SQF01637.1 holliday junction-specific endonuclease [Streptococcus pyogenes]